MYDLILQVFLMASLGTIVFILALAIPRAGESESKANKIREWVHKLPLHRLDETINDFKEKSLRRAKVVVMKLENLINRNLNKDKDNAGLGGPGQL